MLRVCKEALLEFAGHHGARGLAVDLDGDGRADFAVTATIREATTPADVALAWLLNKAHIASPIIGATKMDHLEQAIAALEIQLSAEEVQQLEEPYKPHPVLGH